VLQNEKYIEYANDHTVEVIALGDLEKGLADPQYARLSGTYDGKDEAGNPVKFLKEYAGMTVEQLVALDSSPAAQYNHTGHIPYASIVDPWTLQEVKSMPGGGGVKTFMEAADEESKKLIAEHGPQVRRSVMQKVEASAKTIEASVAKDGVAKALADAQKLQTSVAKEHDVIKARAKALVDKILETAKSQLDDAEGKIGSGDVKGATKILSSLVGALKGTELEQRSKELLDKTKAPAEPAK